MVDSERDQDIATLDSSASTENEDAVQPELLMKHPLEHKWSLWYFKNDRSRDWNDCLKLVSDFGFVEDFWALYNYIQPASKLASGCDYSVFKHGVQPAWEDEKNKKGGRWMINLNKAQRYEELDRFWLEILLCMIGEAFGNHADEMCGAVVNVRGKGDKVGVWTSNGANKEGILHIGHTLKERLQIPSKVTIAYQLHMDSMSKTGSVTRNKFIV